MRSNKPVNMDIEQLRGWSTFIDRALVVSLVATVLAIAALATTTWLSFRFGGALRAHEQAAFDRYKAEMGKHAVALEQKVSTAEQRTTELERAAADANTRAAEATRESATSREKARTAEIDAEEVRKRVAELGKMVREARERPPQPAPGSVAAIPEPQPQLAPPPPASPPVSPIVESLRKYAGTKAAVYVVGEVADAAAAGEAIADTLGDAGWVHATWTWSGVGGILGVVVLVKDGSDPVTTEAAAAVVEALRAAGFNAAKGDWPAGASWSRFRGMLKGPETRGPTEAAIRIVVGAKAR
jgi:hypothetical protein